MNERIRALWETNDSITVVWPETGSPVRVSAALLEKFAELIVRECVNRVTTKANGWGDMTGFAIKESILDCAKDLKEHFGVEE